MRQVIKLEQLQPSKRAEILETLERNKPKRKRIKRNINRYQFSVTDYLKWITNKLKR